MRIHLLAAAIVLLPLAAHAEDKPCPIDRAIYGNVESPGHTLTFEGSNPMGLPFGLMSLEAGGAKLSYRVASTVSNGFSRVYVSLGKTAKQAESQKAIARSEVISLESDFKVYRGEGASPFIVMPDIAQNLYYSDGFRERNGYVDLLPGPSWKLKGCRP